VTESEKADIKDTVKHNYNPVPLGTLYFCFSLSLWSSEQISDPQTKGVAIFFTIISFIFFVAVFSQYVLTKLNKWVQKPLVFLTFLVFLFGFTFGWLQAFLQTSGLISQVIAYSGFAWIVVFLLTFVRDAAKHGKRQRLFTFLIIAAFLIIAVIKFYNHDLWSGGYLIGIAVLAFLVAMDWVKVHGGIFE